MRTYRVPILLNVESKPFGGRLSLRQAAYILAGLILAIGTFYPIKSIVGVEIAAGFALAVFGAGVALALVQLHGLGLSLDRYLLLRLRFSVSQREFPYAGRRMI